MNHELDIDMIKTYTSDSPKSRKLNVLCSEVDRCAY